MKTKVFPALSRSADLLAPECRTGLLVVLLAVVAVPVALANNVSESAAWQFQTSADKVNQAAVQDMIQKRNMGYYTAPVYTTNIDRQINCNQSANATGNASDQGAAALSPSNSGASGTAKGNESSSTDGQSSNDQGNSGGVGSHITGNTTTAVNGSADQALNNNQHNSGTQTASVAGSTGCTFGVLN